jgi:DNA-binding helix-hairpin-helix protein with protein kinase domain
VRIFCDLQGREAGLGRCLGRGGEGAVYSVPMWPGSVAKIYARRPDESVSRKLSAMVQLGTAPLASFAAWPQNLLLDPKSGSTVGFVMPRVEGHREIHTLYGPTDRKTAFPDASWSFLVRTARNVAAAFATVHEHGHVLGDVNQGNVVVSRKAAVRLIDCDSFQISHLGHTYPCRVGVPLYTPPELQGLRLDDVVRTREHDRFGLAVLVFQLLFMGRHPFVGRHPQRALTMEAAIKEGLFAFGSEAARRGWESPPFSLRLAEVPSPIVRLFESAFGRDAAAGGPRPSAAKWVSALDELDARIVPCGDDPRHTHARGSGPCPWCRIENEGGPSFFFLAPGTAPDAFDLATTCQAIDAVRSPGPAPAAPNPPAAPSPGKTAELLDAAARWRPRPLTVTLALAGVVVLGATFHTTWYGSAAGVSGLLAAVLAGFGLVRYLRSERGPDDADADERRERALAAAEADVRRLLAHWDEMCGDAAFVSRRKELEKAKTAFLELDPAEVTEWTELTERFRERRLLAHLGTFRLEFARIPGLGPGPLERLASRGVQTAADVSPGALMAIPHIDLGLVRGLLLFKGVATRSFQFDPVAGIPGRDRKALEDAQARRRQNLVSELQGGALELAGLRRQALGWRDVLGRSLDEAHRRVAQVRREGGLSGAPPSLACRPR